MIVLGIECTAHTFSVGIIKNSKVLANVIDTYSGGTEGLIPRKLADHHAQVFISVLNSALETVNLTMEDVDLIAFSQGPGIGSPLSAGISGAKYLALRYDKSLIGVNHPFAHVKISEYYSKLGSPLVLYLSGGNSQILLEWPAGSFNYQVLGETLDMGVGNMFDSFARAINLDPANGGTLSKIAQGGKYIPLPYSVKGLNFVFSGLQTAAERAVNVDHQSKQDIAYSLLETAFTMICEATERAIFLTKKRSLIVCGGVAQNKRLQSMLRSMCREDGIRFGVAPDEFNRDNGAMIAYAGLLLYKKYGATRIEDCKPITNYRIDRMNSVLG